MKSLKINESINILPSNFDFGNGISGHIQGIKRIKVICCVRIKTQLILKTESMKSRFFLNEL